MSHVQIKNDYCKACGMRTRFERHAVPMGVGDLVMTLITVGIWPIARWLNNPYRCSTCGSRS